MKRLTASEARRNWFRVLDEVAAGAVVAIERHGRRIVLRREEEEPTEPTDSPDYAALLRVPEGSRAEAWSWTWGSEGELIPDDEDE